MLKEKVIKHFPYQFRPYNIDQFPSNQQRKFDNNNLWLSDLEIEHFHNLLRHCSNYKPISTGSAIQNIKEIPIYQKNIQILYDNNVRHWICTYYDGNGTLYIYDSFGEQKLCKMNKEFLEKLHPYVFEDNKRIKFPNVQRQIGCNDCGFFAIAFGISRFFGY